MASESGPVVDSGDEPLTAKDRAMIDAAWETHRAAAPKTLLDGFGEATDQVVALRAERDALQAQVAAMEDIRLFLRQCLFAGPEGLPELRAAAGRLLLHLDAAQQEPATCAQDGRES